MNELAHARLWVTPAGNIIERDGGIGVLPFDVPLGSWTPSFVSAASPRIISANDSLLVLWLDDDSVSIRDAHQAENELARVPVSACSANCETPTVVVSDDSILLSVNNVRQWINRGNDGGWFAGAPAPVIPVYGTIDINATWGSDYWTCGAKSFEYGKLESGTLQPQVQAFMPYPVDCLGYGILDRPVVTDETAGQGAFVACPFVTDGGVTWKAVSDPCINRCFGGLFYGNCQNTTLGWVD